MGLIEEILEAQERRRARPARKPWSTDDSKPLTKDELDKRLLEIQNYIFNGLKRLPRIDALTILYQIVDAQLIFLGPYLFEARTGDELDAFERMLADLLQLKYSLTSRIEECRARGERLDPVLIAVSEESE